MKITNSEVKNRDLEVTIDQSGKMKIGAGWNTENPQLEIHPDDVETLIKLILVARDSKLPNPTQ